MTDENQIRINELARELEVKAKAIIDYLPEAGVTEKKTHSSSIDLAAAEKVRKHFQDLAAAEAPQAAASRKAEAEKIAKEAAAKAARLKLTAPPAPLRRLRCTGSCARSLPSAATASAPAPPAPPAACRRRRRLPRLLRRRRAPFRPPFRQRAASAARRAARRGPPGACRGRRRALRPRRCAGAPQPPAAPAAPAAGARRRAMRRASAGVPGMPPSGMRRGPSRRTPRSGCARRACAPDAPVRCAPMRPVRRMRPGAPMRPGMPPARPAAFRRVPGHRPMRPGGAGHAAARGAPPKAEPGKPIYERKPAARARPTLEKRFEEGERKLHPVRARPGVGERRTARVEPVVAPPPRPPREITITEGITVRDLAEKLDVRAKDVLKELLDRGVFASINQALDVPTATSLAEVIQRRRHRRFL